MLGPKRWSLSARRGALALAAALLFVAPASPARADGGPAPRVLTMAETIALARERAPAVHAAMAKIGTSEGELTKARAGLLPSATLIGMGTAYTSQGTIFVAGLTSADASQQTLVGQASVNLQWTLFDFGKTSSAIEAAQAGLRSSESAAKAIEQLAMAEAAVAYFTLLADDGLVQAAEAARADREHVEAITRRVVAAGFRPPVDETRAEVGVDVAKLDVAVARATRENDSASLAAALMLDPSTGFRLEAVAAPAAGPVAVGPGMAVEIDARPRVVAARQRVERMRLELEAAKGARLPSVSLQGQGAVLYTSDRVQGVGSNTPSAFASGALNLTIPLFDPQTNATVRIAEAAVSDAQANLEQVTVTARSDAALVWRQLESTRAILEQSERLGVGTAANLAAVEERYASGSESPLAVADAQREDALAQVSVVKARLAFDVARVRLLAQLSRVEELGR